MDEEKRGSSKRGAKIADLESGSLVVPPAQVMIMIRYKSHIELNDKLFLLQIQKRGGDTLHYIIGVPSPGPVR